MNSWKSWKTDEELARGIAHKLGGFQEAFDGAMAMAEIKNKQIKHILSALSEKSADPRDFYNELCDEFKPLDFDISHIISDNFWYMI